MKTDLAFYDTKNRFEKEFWGDCANTYGEETKQFVYADRMGMVWNNYVIDLAGKSVLDIGGGPVSLLLKCVNFRMAGVIDPIEYPSWVYSRYATHRIRTRVQPGEEIVSRGWDEVWIYNVLQHCRDPQKVIDKAKGAGKVLRIFEWIDFEPSPGHPHMLTEADLNEWIGGIGQTELLNEKGCYGKAYYGVFEIGETVL